MNKSTNSRKSFLTCFCMSLFRNMTYLNKQTVQVLLVTVLLCLQLSPPKFSVHAIETAAASPRVRHNRNPGCNEDQQNKMNDEYKKCIQEFTNRHHSSIGTAISREDHQKYTCQLLADTVECDGLLSRCLSHEEVEDTKDGHILARINQYADNKDGINIKECPIAKDYVDSGRADKVDETTVGGCTHSEASGVQNDFQQCSHQLTQKVWDDINKMEEKKQQEKGIPDKETNDILEEEQRNDQVQLDAPELKNILCAALQDIGDKCTDVITKCFSQDDVQQMRYNHVVQMEKYYSGIYTTVELSDCSALQNFAVSNPCDNPDEPDENGDYVNCDDEIYPQPPDDDDDELIDTQIEDSGTSNNIKAPTTPSSKTEPPSPNNVVKEPVNPTNSNNKDNGGNTDSIKTEYHTQHDDGNSNKATFILVALTSVILATLCN